jgi:guanylate kinase
VWDDLLMSGRVGRLLVLSGPSGVGKSTVVRHLRDFPTEWPGLWLSVSATTRTPRAGEIDGTHYTFLSDAQFDAEISRDAFLEWANFAGYRYGTPRDLVAKELAAGRDVLLEIDLQGARQVRASGIEATMVFLAPPNWEELVRRLLGRGTEDEGVIERRLAHAREELAAQGEFDYVIVNSEVGEVVSALVALAQS